MNDNEERINYNKRNTEYKDRDHLGIRKLMSMIILR